MQNLMELGDLPEEFMSDLKDGIPNKNIDYAKNCIQM